MIQLQLDAFGRLVLTLPDGLVVVGVTPVRGFPFTSSTEHISLCDETGREVVCIGDLEELPAPTKELLEQELARREFVPIIRRIVDIQPAAEPSIWQVETDRGIAQFKLTSEDHVRRLGAHGALIADAHGVRYRVLDAARLDAHSRRMLNRYL